MRVVYLFVCFLWVLCEYSCPAQCTSKNNHYPYSSIVCFSLCGASIVFSLFIQFFLLF